MPSSFVIIIELKQGGDSNGSLMREILPKAVRLTRKQGGYIVNRKLLSLFMAIVMTLSIFPFAATTPVASSNLPAYRHA